MKFQSGQFGIKELIIIGSSIIVPLALGLLGLANRNDNKLEIAKAEQQANVLAISQRITASEVKVDNLQNDLKEVKQDVKEILKVLRK